MITNAEKNDIVIFFLLSIDEEANIATTTKIKVSIQIKAATATIHAHTKDDSTLYSRPLFECEEIKKKISV